MNHKCPYCKSVHITNSMPVVEYDRKRSISYIPEDVSISFECSYCGKEFAVKYYLDEVEDLK